MSRFNTGNPVGSNDARDRDDNSKNFDELINSTTKESQPDRLGVPRKTWHGMEQDFQDSQNFREDSFQGAQDARQQQFLDSQDVRQQRFNDFIENSGYIGTGPNGAVEDYAAGIEITEYNQIIRDPTSGEFWRLSGEMSLPYTTTGAGLPEGGALVGVGDAVLRQELASGTASVFSSTGDQTFSDAIDQRAINIGSIQELNSINVGALKDGQTILVKEYHSGEGIGGGIFTWDSSVDPSDNDGGFVISPEAVSAWDGTLANIRDLYDTVPMSPGAFVRQSKEASTFDFGLVQGEAASIEAVKQFEKYCLSPYLPLRSASYTASIPLLENFTIFDADRPSVSDIHFAVNMDGQSFTSSQALLTVRNLDYSIRATGTIGATAGGVSLESRRHPIALRLISTERSILPILSGVGGIRAGVSMSGGKTTLSIIPKITVSRNGIDTDIDAFNYVNEGAGTSINQSTTFETTFDLSNVSAGDFIVADGVPYRISSVSGQQIQTFPMIPSSAHSETVNLIAGSGFEIYGGDASLVDIGYIDGVGNSVLYRPESLYPPLVRTLHGNSVGIGIALGRNRNSSRGGGILNYYLEQGATFDLVETSPAISGFFIASMSGAAGENMINIANPSGRGFRTVTTTVLAGIASGNGIGIFSNNGSAQQSTIDITEVSTPGTWLRNTGTINVWTNARRNRRIGRDYQFVNVYGFGANREPQGTITINPPDGWQIKDANGLKDSINRSGFNNPVKFEFMFDYRDNTLMVTMLEMMVI